MGKGRSLRPEFRPQRRCPACPELRGPARGRTCLGPALPQQYHPPHAQQEQHRRCLTSSRSPRGPRSRGNPTVEVEVFLASGASGAPIVPSGASTGQFEAVELRDGGDRYLGKGVLQAVDHVNDECATPSRGWRGSTSVDRPPAARPRRHPEQGEPRRQRAARDEPRGGPRRRRGDGPPAVALRRRGQRPRAAHADDERPQRRRARRQLRGLPGVHDHAGRRRQLQRGAAVGRRDVPHAQELLHDRGLSTAVGDEGGFAPDLDANEDACKLLLEAIERAGYAPGEQIAIALDPASTELSPTRAPTSSSARAAR